MLPTFSGGIGRKTYWSGLISWIAMGLIFSILVIGLVNAIHPDKNQPSNYVNNIGAFIFITGFIFVLLHVISLIFRRSIDIAGSSGIILALVTLLFSPLILILGIIPGKTKK